MQWIFILLFACVIRLVHLSSWILVKTGNQQLMQRVAFRITHTNAGQSEKIFGYILQTRLFQPYPAMGEPDKIEVYNYDDNQLQLSYISVRFQQLDGSYAYVYHCTTDCFIEPSATKTVSQNKSVILRSENSNIWTDIHISINITGTTGTKKITKSHFIRSAKKTKVFIPLNEDIDNPYQIDVLKSGAGDWTLRYVKIINSNGHFTFMCFCPIEEPEKKTLPGKKAVAVRHSGSFDAVTFAITGTNGNTIKTYNWRGYWSNSTTVFSLNQDINIGDPFKVDVHQQGKDTWNLDYVEVWIERKTYRFDCHCFLNDSFGVSGVFSSMVSIVTICPNTTRHLQCIGGGFDVIDIIKGQTGRWDNSTCYNAEEDNGYCDVTTLNETHFNTCQGKQQCEFKYPDVQLENDPCSYRYAILVFKCKENVPTTSFTTSTMPPPTVTDTTKTKTLETTTTAISATDAASIMTTTIDYNKSDANLSFCCESVMDCNCFCVPSFFGDTGCALEDVDCVVSALREQLIIDVETTSSFKRKKISAFDGRTSSRMIGAVGVVLLVTAALVIVVPDCITLMNFLRTKLKKNVLN